jgi:hypothetical protein
MGLLVVSNSGRVEDLIRSEPTFAAQQLAIKRSAFGNNFMDCSLLDIMSLADTVSLTLTWSS